MIKELQDTLNKILPTFTLGHVRYRGLLIPLDPWMKGTLRFATKLGGQGSVWKPDFVFTTTQDTASGEYLFYVDHIIKDIQIGSVILVNNLKNRIADFDFSDEDSPTVTLENYSSDPILANTKLTVWSFPVEVEGSAFSGQQYLRVSTPLFLARGDVLEIPISSGNWGLVKPYNIDSVDFVEEDVEGKKYILKLETPLTRNVATDEILYIRSYPAYASGHIAFPSFGAARLNVVGPFLVDYLSGPLVKGVTYEEFLSVSLGLTDGTPLSPLARVGNHNVQVNRMPIEPEQFLFWKLLKGKINYDGLNVVCQLDSDGLWRLVYRMSPYMDVPGEHAIGSILPVEKSKLNNNEYLIIPDGIISSSLEFKVDDSFVKTNGRIVVDVSSTSTASQVADLLSQTINSAYQLDLEVTYSKLSNNDTLTLTDGTDEVVFELKLDELYVKSDTSYVTVDLSSASNDATSATLLAESLTLNYNKISCVGVLSTVQIVNISYLYSLPQITSSNTAGISVSNPLKLNLTSSVARGIVNLVNKAEGDAGNILITNNIVDVDFRVSGMTGGGGGIDWITTVQSDGDAKMFVKLYPNTDQEFTIPSGTTHHVIRLAADDSPVELIDIRFASDLESATPATEIKFNGWSLFGSRTGSLDATVVIRTDSTYFGASSLYLKPLWPNLDWIQTRPDEQETNTYSLIL